MGMTGQKEEKKGKVGPGVVWGSAVALTLIRNSSETPGDFNSVHILFILQQCTYFVYVSVYIGQKLTEIGQKLEQRTTFV